MSHNQTYEETARKISYHPVPAHSRNVKVTAVFFRSLTKLFWNFFWIFLWNDPKKFSHLDQRKITKVFRLFWTNDWNQWPKCLSERKTRVTATSSSTHFFAFSFCSSLSTWSAQLATSSVFSATLGSSSGLEKSNSVRPIEKAPRETKAKERGNTTPKRRAERESGDESIKARIHTWTAWYYTRLNDRCVCERNETRVGRLCTMEYFKGIYSTWKKSNFFHNHISVITQYNVRK